MYIFRPNEPGKEFSENTEEARILSAYLSQESGRTSIGTTDLSKKNRRWSTNIFRRNKFRNNNKQYIK